ncbi:unnamed protein product [Durusdinium trenchii]|uniref:Ion transport domain-containing protein n=1 Tax=Durusdinium trenchii TaxID=1381693 RepID=A0ABP0L0S1_9DINO
MDSESTTKERSGGLGMQLPGGLSRQMSAMSASEAKASWTMMNFSSNVSEVGPIDEEQWSFKRLRAFIEDRFQRQERMMERLSNQIRSLDKDSQSKVAATESMAFSEFSEGVQLPVPLEYTTTTNAPTENVAGDEPVHKIGSMGSLRSSPSHCPKPRANSGSILPRFSKKLTRGQSDVSALSRTSARITREQTHKALAVLNQKSVLSPVSGNSEAESPASVEAFRFGDLPTCLVESAYFSHVVQFVIMVNLILLGVEVQYSTWGRVPGIFSIINYVIVTFFVAELAVRLLAFGCRGFFFGPERLWNILDACIVVISLFETGLEIVLEAVSDPGNDQNSSYLRALRLARLARALRSVRVMRFLRYIAALRTLILSIISTLGPLIWTLALLVLLFYLFAVILTQMVTDYCRYELGAPNNAQCDEKVVNHWQDVPESMLTLFLSITGGLSWEEALKPLRSVPHYKSQQGWLVDQLWGCLQGLRDEEGLEKDVGFSTVNEADGITGGSSLRSSSSIFLRLLEPVVELELYIDNRAALILASGDGGGAHMENGEIEEIKKEPEMAEVAVEEGGGANYLFVAVEPQIQPAAEPPAKEVAMERASVQRVTMGRADEAEKAAIMMFGGRGHKTCPETFRETFVPTSPLDYEELEGLRDHGAPDEGRYANFAALARLFRKKLSGEADEGGDFFLLS